MKKSKAVRLLARLGIYCLGLWILAFGIALSVNCNLGVSPVSSLPYVVSQISKVSLGTCTTVVYSIYILLQMVLNGRKFQPALVLQLVFSTIFGYFVDGAKALLGDFVLPTYFGQLAMLAASIVLIGFSLVLYIDVELAPMPAEGLVGCIAGKLGKPFSTVKTLFDCTSVLVGAVLCFVFFGKLVGIREGTVITALLAGRVMGMLRKYLSPVIRKVCFGE
ncbi:MAG: hypothetical protein IJN67_11480 [Oscillospiraceae bacterium]|nr:hypothetical protein [Oscillospiraceae bacterium]